MFPECSMGGAIYLLSPKEFVETGKGRPHPYDMPVRGWLWGEVRNMRQALLNPLR